MSQWRAQGPFVVGHRGGRGDGWPTENTLEAFARAADEGAPAVELDVRLAGSGEVVVFHDVDLARITGGARRERVAELSLAELARAAGVPSLAEVLAWARERGVAVNVELKHDVPRKRDVVQRALRVIAAARADVLLSSFHPGMLLACAALAPGVPRAALTHLRQGGQGRALHRLARGPLFFGVHLEDGEVRPDLVARFHRRGLRVGTWTVNDGAEAARLVAAGVDYVITDAPGLTRSALRGSLPPRAAAG